MFSTQILKFATVTAAIALSCTAIAGTDNGGGGNGSGTTIVTDYDIKQSVQAAKVTFLYHLKYQESLIDIAETPSQKGDTFISKIARNAEQAFKFSDKSETPYQTLQQTTIELRTDKACYYDSDPTPKDASAHRSTKDICFSLPRLRKHKYTKSDLDKKVLALFAHEFAHLRGLGHTVNDEKLGNDIRDLAESQMPGLDQSAVGLAIMDAKQHMLDQVKSLDEQVQFLTDKTADNLAQLPDSSMTVLCMGIYGQARNLMNGLAINPPNLGHMGLYLFDDRFFARYLAAALIVNNAAFACMDIPEGNSPFGSKTEITIAELEKSSTLSPIAMAMLEQYTIPHMSYVGTSKDENRGQARLKFINEYERGVQLFKQLNEEFQTYPTPAHCEFKPKHDGYTCSF